MAATPCHVRDSIREVDAHSWVIGGRLLLSRRPSPPPASGIFWSDGAGSFYVLAASPQPLPESRPLHPTASPFTKVYDLGDASAVWTMGEAVCKIKDGGVPSMTREHVTIAALRRRSLSFAVPEVLHHDESADGRYYLFLRKIHGQTVHEAWPLWSEEQKHGLVCQVVAVCKELAEWQSGSISGVDGGHLAEPILADTDGDYRPSELLRAARELKMDCSTFQFYHCDLGPGNIIVDAAGGRIVGIIDWEMAGFVPRDYIATKFSLGSGLDLNVPGGEFEKRVDYRKRVRIELGSQDFRNFATQWVEWSESTHH